MKTFVRKYSAWLYLLLCFLLLALVTFVRIFHLGLTNADMASELVLARELFEEKALLTTHWYYSTELRVLHAQALFAPLFGIFSSWHTVRFVGTLFLYALLAAAYLYMARKLRMGSLAPVFAGCLLLPLSAEYFYYVLYGAFYSPYLICSFFLIGLVFDAPFSPVKRVISWAALFILSFLIGLSGFRELLLLFLPLFAAALAHALSSPATSADRYSPSDRVLLYRCFSALLSSLLGCGVNRLLQSYYYFKAFDSVSYTPFSFTALGNVLQGFFTGLGFASGGCVFGADTLLNAAAFLLCALFLFALYTLFRYRDGLNTPHHVLLLYTITAFLLFTLLYVFTDMEYAVRYSLPLVVFFFPLLEVCLESRFLSPLIRRCAFLCLTLSVCASTFYLYSTQLRRDYSDERQIIAQICQQEGYTQGYATFWNANIMSEYSDGAISVWTIQSRASTSPEDLVKYQQLTSHFTQMPKGKVFVLLENDEYASYDFTRYLPKENILFAGDRFIAFGFDSDAQLRALLPHGL